ncbi:MAG: hypothetical protein HY731_09230 [Candidatus Tectomicrobia bacterium]|nr:hypothetical protein [Candidatus Tectomicrobia bacterium]
MGNLRLKMIQEMIEQDPNDPTLYVMLAYEYFEDQKYLETIETIQTYLQMASDEGAIYKILGQSLEQLGEAEAARRAYEQGIAAAMKHGHKSLAAEIQELLKKFQE